MGNLKNHVMLPEPRLLENPGLLLIEERGIEFVKINTRTLTPELRAAIVNGADCALPNDVNRSVNMPGYTMVRTAPFHWLAIGAEDKVESLRMRATEHIKDQAVLVTDLTDGRTSFRISGRSTLEFLSGLMPLDFHPDSFKPGHTATTLLGETGAFIQCLGNEPDFRILVDQSYADYVWRLFIVTAQGLDGQSSAA